MSVDKKSCDFTIENILKSNCSSEGDNGEDTVDRISSPCLTDDADADSTNPTDEDHQEGITYRIYNIHKLSRRRHLQLLL